MPVYRPAVAESGCLGIIQLSPGTPRQQMGPYGWDKVVQKKQVSACSLFFCLIYREEGACNADGRMTPAGIEPPDVPLRMHRIANGHADVHR